MQRGCRRLGPGDPLEPWPQEGVADGLLQGHLEGPGPLRTRICPDPPAVGLSQKGQRKGRGHGSQVQTTQRPDAHL